MEIDPGVTAAIDEVLTTTRAVRRRLDLERDVNDEILLECIDIAEQAPTGGNQGSRRWLIVRDPELKQGLAQLYRDVIGDRMIEARDRLAGTGDPRERAMASSAHLAEHLGEVPAIVIPVILGRHDGSGRPGLFDSVIQSGWSFCLALRARGLGTAWTTAGLAKAPEIKELLGIPPDVTEIRHVPGGLDRRHRLQDGPAASGPPRCLLRRLRPHLRAGAQRSGCAWPTGRAPSPRSTLRPGWPRCGHG